jgi:hypothetical protein
VSDNYNDPETLGLRYGIYDSEGHVVYQETVDAVQLQQGSHIIYSKKWSDVVGKIGPENLFIRVELFNMASDLNKYERSQKLTMRSTEWIAQGATISRHYDDKRNKKRITLRDSSILQIRTGKQINK